MYNGRDFHLAKMLSKGSEVGHIYKVDTCKVCLEMKKFNLQCLKINLHGEIMSGEIKEGLGIGKRLKWKP